jgi:MerR family redox-sensitive transcriptional activator SoxR
MNKLTIGEVARRTGVRTSALRYYESEDLIHPSGRLAGHRVYTDDVLKQLALIKLAQDAGFSIAEIRALFHDFSPGTSASVRWQNLASDKLQEIEQQIDRALQMKRLLQHLLQCQCGDLLECVT